MIFPNVISWLGGDLGVAVTGRSFIVDQRDGRPPLVVTADFPVPPPVIVRSEDARMPDGSPVPPGVWDGLATRRHQRTEPAAASSLAFGWIADVPHAQEALRHGIRKMGRRWVRPRVVATANFGHPLARRALLDALKRAGARRVFLTPYPMTCAMGLGLPVDEATISGVLALESDWMEFGLMRHAANLATTSAPVGTQALVDDLYWHLRDKYQVLVDPRRLHGLLAERGIDLRGSIAGQAAVTGAEPSLPAAADLGPGEAIGAMGATLSRIARTVRATWDDLTREQLRGMHTRGIHLCGEAAAIPGLPAALASRLGVTVHVTPTDVHPAIKGLRVYRQHLDEWQRTMGIDENSGAPGPDRRRVPVAAKPPAPNPTAPK